MRTPDPFYWAVKYGYTHLDTAAFYRNEKDVGEQVRRAMQEFGLKRENLFITSKIPPDLQGYDKAKKCIEKSLANLDLDYIDLMLIHWPGTSGL